MWTVECALLSAVLNRHDIVAKFNVQDCDYEQVKQRLLQTFSVAMGDVHYELAEYAQNEKNLDGSIGLAWRRSEVWQEHLAFQLA